MWSIAWRTPRVGRRQLKFQNKEASIFRNSNDAVFRRVLGPLAPGAERLPYVFRIPLDAFLRFNEGDGWAIASHIALSTLMSLFPFLIIVTALAGLFGSKDLADELSATFAPRAGSRNSARTSAAVKVFCPVGRAFTRRRPRTRFSAKPPKHCCESSSSKMTRVMRPRCSFWP